jgi:predicted amidophosphoribosyltransferase
VHRWKYTGARALAELVGAALAGTAKRHVPAVDAVTWVPCARARRRALGQDPTAHLAAVVARHLGVSVVPLLARSPGPPQTGRSRSERSTGPGLHALGLVPQRVLVVDDVVTTGASVRLAAAALRQAGASSVSVAALARTPSAPQAAREQDALDSAAAGLSGERPAGQGARTRP